MEDTIEPGQLVSINKLQGNINESVARIFPVKRFTGTQPYDAGLKHLAVPHLFGSDTNAYWKVYNWTNALASGMAYIGKPFSGNVGYVNTEMFWIQNHMVAPKKQALTCVNCHRPNGRLNFAKLGYSAERANDLSNMFPEHSFRILAMKGGAEKALEISWEAVSGGVYKIQYSNNLTEWADVDGKLISPASGVTSVSWKGTQSSQYRYYRVNMIRQN